MDFEVTTPQKNSNFDDDHQYHKGVRYLCEKGLTKLPSKYIFPAQEQPITSQLTDSDHLELRLPVIDFSQLLGPDRSYVLRSLSKACEEYGFFQLVNHGISSEVSENMIKICKEFFELPFSERSKYMNKDMRALVRCGTSFNQNKDKVFCWRDFLKLNCLPVAEALPSWPSSPSDLRKAAVTYANETRTVYLSVMEAILESLGVNDGEEISMKDFEEGSQMLVVNCYPSCPEPDLTLGMPPHSDYGMLTMLLQDEVQGLQIRHAGKWIAVKPIPGSFVVNVGDHLEIFSNGIFKSVLHRVLVNSQQSRISVASLHSLGFERMIRPAAQLINERMVRRYMDTDFGSFLKYLSSDDKNRSRTFLDSRKLT